MKLIAPLLFLISLLLLVYSALQTPILKLPTDLALERIEAGYLRSDLNEEEKEHLSFLKDWISWNQEGSYAAYTTAMKSLTLITFIVGTYNIFLFIGWIKRQLPNKTRVQIASSSTAHD